MAEIAGKAPVKGEMSQKTYKYRIYTMRGVIWLLMIACAVLIVAVVALSVTTVKESSRASNEADATQRNRLVLCERANARRAEALTHNLTAQDKIVLDAAVPPHRNCKEALK